MENTPEKPFTDTAEDAEYMQIEALRNMTGAERAEMTFKLCNQHRAILIAGIKHRHPDYNEDQVAHAVQSLILDKKTLKEIYGTDEVTA